VVRRHWRCVHIPQVETAIFCYLEPGGKFTVVIATGKEDIGVLNSMLLLHIYLFSIPEIHQSGYSTLILRYWWSLALKVGSGWCLTDHCQGQEHTNLDVLSPTSSGAPARVQATTAYGRMDLHFHHLNLRTADQVLSILDDLCSGLRPVICLTPSHLNSTGPISKNGRLGRSHSRSKYLLPLPAIEIQFLGCTVCTTALKIS
jgi:hypothetical protein